MFTEREKERERGKEKERERGKEKERERERGKEREGGNRVAVLTSILATQGRAALLMH